MQTPQLSPRSSAVQPFDGSSSAQSPTATGLHLQVTQSSAPRSQSHEETPARVDVDGRSVAATAADGPRANASPDGVVVIHARPSPDAMPQQQLLKRCDNALIEVETLMRVPGDRSETATARIGLLMKKVTAATRHLPDRDAERFREAILKVYLREIAAGCASPALARDATKCLALIPGPLRKELWKQVFVTQNQRLVALVTSIGTFQIPVGPGDLAMVVNYARWAGDNPVHEKQVATLALAARRVCSRQHAADLAAALLRAIGRSASTAPMADQLGRIHEVCELVQCTDSLEGALDFYASCAAQAREQFPQGDEQWIVLRHAVRHLMNYCEGEHSVDGAKEQVARLTYLLDPDGKGKGTRNVYDRSWLVNLRADLRKRVTGEMLWELKRHAGVTASQAKDLAQIVDGRQRSDMLVSYQQCRLGEAVALHTGMPREIAEITAQYANSGSTFPPDFDSEIRLMPEYRGIQGKESGKRALPHSAAPDDTPDQNPAKRR